MLAILHALKKMLEVIENNVTIMILYQMHKSQQLE